MHASPTWRRRWRAGRWASSRRARLLGGSSKTPTASLVRPEPAARWENTVADALRQHSRAALSATAYRPSPARRAVQASGRALSGCTMSRRLARRRGWTTAATCIMEAPWAATTGASGGGCTRRGQEGVGWVGGWLPCAIRLPRCALLCAWQACPAVVAFLCPHRPLPAPTCTWRSRDVHIECGGPAPAIQLRLVGGTPWNGQYANGRLEVVKDGVWGTASQGGGGREKGGAAGLHALAG